MNITFFGVRGSLPYSSRDTAEFGSNTPCVLVTSDSPASPPLILDAGSGIYGLNKTLHDAPAVIILFSHLHWDHILGLPYFHQFYKKDRTVYLVIENPALEEAVLSLWDGIRFPISKEMLSADIHFITENSDHFLARHGYKVTSIRNNHPGIAYSYRIEAQNKSLVYATDNELHPPMEIFHTSYEDFCRFCNDADVLIHDAHFIKEEQKDKKGWGHTTIREVVTLAQECNAKKTFFFHHHPLRTDAELKHLQNEISQTTPPFSLEFAREGNTYIL